MIVPFPMNALISLASISASVGPWAVPSVVPVQKFDEPDAPRMVFAFRCGRLISLPPERPEDPVHRIDDLGR